MTQQCAVAGLPRETNDGCFDAANANKSCVRVHAGQSSEFPIYPTTRERGIRLESVAVKPVMEATQQNEYKLNVDHQTKQNTIPKMRACVYGLYI